MDTSKVSNMSLKDQIEIIDNMKPKEFAMWWTKFSQEIKKDPIKNFIEHPLFIGAGKEEGERYVATPAVRVVVNVFFNLELDSKVKCKVRVEDFIDETDQVMELGDRWFLTDDYMTETEIYEFMTGKTYTYNVDTYITMMELIMGRRAGKTALIAILSIMTVILDNWAPFLFTHPKATTLIMAQRKKDAEEILEVLKYNIDKSPVLRKFRSKIHKDNTEEFNLTIPWIRYDYKKTPRVEYSYVQIAAEVASAKAVRGKTCVCIMLDEFAFIGTKDSEAKINDKDLLTAVKKNTDTIENFRLLPLSSPNITEGVFYETFLKWNNDELDPLSNAVFKSPAWFFNPYVREKNLRKEYKDDGEDAFDRESRGNFQQASGGFLKEDWITHAIIDNSLGRDEIFPESGYSYTAAIDPSDTTGGDSFTFTVWGHNAQAQDPRDKLKQFVVKAWKGKKDKPVRRRDIAEFIASKQAIYNFPYVYSDQREYQSLREIFAQHNLILEKRNFTSGNRPYKIQAYYSLRNSLRDRNVNMLNIPQQTKEAKELIYETSTTGREKIRHPRGGHDDFMDVNAISVHELLSDDSSFEASIAPEDQGVADFGMGESASRKCKRTGKGFTAPTPSEYLTASSKQDNKQGKATQYKSNLDHLINDRERFYITIPALDMSFNLNNKESYADFKENFPEVEQLYALGILKTSLAVNKAMDYAFNEKFESYLETDHPNLDYSKLSTSNNLLSKYGDNYEMF